MALSKILQTDNYYTTNMYKDMIRGKEELSDGPIGFGVLATSKGNMGDINFGVSTTYGHILKSYQHWFSGGEITTPMCNAKSLIYTERGVSAVIGYLANNKNYYLTNYKNSLRNILHGDIGHYTHDGYLLGILSGGPAIMMANPMASIEVYDLDTSVKINSLNYIHNHSLGVDKISHNMKKNISNETKQWNQDINSDSYPYSYYRGSVGNIVTHHIDNKYHCNIRPSGDTLIQTTSDYIISNDTIPTINKLYGEYNPETTDNDKNETYIEKFSWVSGDGRISQEPYFLKSLNKMYYKGFSISEDDSSKYKLLASLLHVRDDGSIILMSKSGSSIELSADGNITISPKNHLKIQSGGNLSILSGGYANIVSRKTNTIRSTDESLQLISETGTHLYSTESNTIEAKNNYIISKSNLTEISQNKNEKIQKQYIMNCPIVHTQGNTLTSKFENVQTDYENYKHLSNSMYVKSNNAIMLQSDRLQWGGKTFKISGTVSGSVTAGTPVIINHVHASGFQYRWCGKGRCKVVRIETEVKDSASLNLPINSVNEQPIDSVSKTLTNGYEENERFYFIPWQLEASTSWSNLVKDINGVSLFPKNNKLYKPNSDGTSLEQTSWNSYKI